MARSSAHSPSFLGEDESYRVIEDGAWHLDQPYGTIHRLASNGKARGVSRACFDFCTAQIGYLRARHARG